jgi:hypothetical protein
MCRILYYYAYLAEEIRPGPGGFTIGVGCPGSRTDTRCTFNEFCQYIWKEQTGINDNVRPKVDLLLAEEDFKEMELETLFTLINEWRDEVTNLGITGNSEPDRVVKGTTNFYDALAQAGRPIGIAQQAVTELTASNPNDDRLKTWKKIVGNGKTAATAVHNLRYKDMEKYRINEINHILGDIVVGTKKVLVTMGFQMRPGETFDAIDADLTIEKWKNLFPNIEAKLADAIEEWKKLGRAAAHWRALCSAEQARLSSGCT